MFFQADRLVRTVNLWYFGRSMLMSEAAEEAARTFGSGPLCAEVVVLAVAREEGLSSPLIPAAATGFCPGLARTGGPCGALLGAVLAVSCVAGRRAPDGSDQCREELGDTYGRVQEVVTGFTERFGRTDCTGLCGCDLSTAEGSRRYRESNAYERCRRFIRTGVDLALNALEDEA
jgi:dihydrofolate reductase